MRIDYRNRTPETLGPEKTDQATENRTLERKGVGNNSDHAVVSDLAQALTSGDPGRLEQLRLEVQSGKYEPAADEVAKSIISAHLND